MKKKHRAQSKNAVKQHFASSAIKSGELRPLEQMSMTDLYTEVNLVRASYKLFLEASRANPQPSDSETQSPKKPAAGLSPQLIKKLLRVQARVLLANRESADRKDQLARRRHAKSANE